MEAATTCFKTTSGQVRRSCKCLHSGKWEHIRQQFTCILGSLALCIIEVGRHSDNSTLHFAFSSNKWLSNLLHLHQHHAADLLGWECLLLTLVSDCKSTLVLRSTRSSHTRYHYCMSCDLIDSIHTEWVAEARNLCSMQQLIVLSWLSQAKHYENVWAQRSHSEVMTNSSAYDACFYRFFAFVLRLPRQMKGIWNHLGCWECFFDIEKIV